MRWRPLSWLLVGLLASAACLWGLRTQRSGRARLTAALIHPSGNSASALAALPPAALSSVSSGATPHASRLSPASFRLSNTQQSIGALIRSDKAILLENALFDTSGDMRLALPERLRAQGDPGSYIVQSRAVLDDSFRALLRRAGASVVSYIPNNAYLVRASAAAAQQLAAEPHTQSVLPYEPYYKLKPPLLELVLTDPAAHELFPLNLLLFPGTRDQTLAALQELGLEVLAESRSPFGPVVSLRAPVAGMPALAGLAGVQELELARARVPASDLSRAALGVAASPAASGNYLGLTGTNVLICVSDTGIDTNHPDLLGRVFLDTPASGVDTNGHGTHVAGIIAGSGAGSLTAANVPGSPLPPSAFQFRGKAPGAALFSAASSQPDSALQEAAARTNAFISNHGWTYGVSEYDLAAASYDAAVRDALPAVTGSQPLLCVFPVGNSGAGAADGLEGAPDSILSPATAKNVISVGALEQLRSVTNAVTVCDTNDPPVCRTNQPWLASSDSSNQVAGFSSRGNVGIGTEGPFGRFKPDVVAPGVFVVAARSAQWDQSACYPQTNGAGSFSEVLSNLNEGLGPFYRFESGASMAAAAVSGTLALMQEFFEQRLGRTNSPALMKALLINGARSLTNLYDLRAHSAINYQGWGSVSLPNSLQPALTNVGAPASSVLLFDQSPLGALATGERRTRLLSVSECARNLPLRVTLVWTDPPANPLAAVKLVNDLDLLVTNLDSGQVFIGNDIAAGASFNAPWEAMGPPNLDSVNNVENVYLSPALGANYSVTVVGRRVNVNAVTAQTNNIVQDYALVISSGDGQVLDALTLTETPVVSEPLPRVTVMTNTFVASPSDSGTLLARQRAGANAPLLDTNTIPLPDAANAVLTLGLASQWHFYVVSNEAGFPNAAFLTFLPHPLADGGLSSCDIDLYVSTEPGLTNLEPAVVASAWKSLWRGGLETIVLPSAVPGPYYLGVKAESGAAAEYGLLAVFSEQPFVQADGLGNQVLRGFAAPALIPGGEVELPGSAQLFAVAPDSALVRRVVVTNTLSHEWAPDLRGTLSHGGISAVLNNHSIAGAVTAQPFIYDDSSELDLPGALHADGPGSLRDFAGTNGFGQWLLTMSSSGLPGTNDSLAILLEPQLNLLGGISAAIRPGACREEFLSVPADATNLTVTVSQISGASSLSLEVCPRLGGPNECLSLPIPPAATTVSLVVDKFSNPPLNAGTYTVRLCNLGSVPADVQVRAALEQDPARRTRSRFTSAQPLAIRDDALTTATLKVTNSNPIVSAAVGVRLDHPRVSDLVLTLVSPGGTRVLLDENRGGLDAAGMGFDTMLTNVVPVSSSGGPQASTNTVDTGSTSGSVFIDYDFYSLPDALRIYYGGNLIFNSGMVSNTGSFSVDFGPGDSTLVTVVMNEGNNTNADTAWDYTFTSVGPARFYTTFTENTNLAPTPIKFAAPPFTKVTFEGTTTTGIFFLPEESLDKLAGQSGLGDWTLEIRDKRAGAADPEPTLLGWQLSFLFKDPWPAPRPLSLAVAQTNSIPANRVQYFSVDVPAWATFATNSLLCAEAPVNLLFNQFALPTGTNASEVALLSGAASGSVTLALSNCTPALLPGARYYLAVQNTGAAPVSVVFQVDFDVTPLADHVPLAASLQPGALPRYFSFDVPANATAVSFELLHPSGNADLVLRKNLPLPTTASYDYGSFFPGTVSEQLILFSNSDPVPLSPGRWYLGAFNASATNVTCSLRASAFTSTVPSIIPLSSGVSFPNTSSGPAGSADFYSYTVSTNALRVQFELNHPTADLSLVARRGLPLPDLASHDFLSANPGFNDELIVIYDYSRPLALAPGEWFLSAVNLSGAPAEYSIKATEFPVYGTNIVITSSEAAAGSFCLTWTAVAGIHYSVQGKVYLEDTNWTTLSPTLTADSSLATWCLPLPSDYHLFRIREGLVVTTPFIPPALVIEGIASSSEGVRLHWTASPEAQFNVEWTPTLEPPAWSVFTNLIASTNSSFFFLDDGSQSAGLGPTRFYRLLQLP